MREVAIYVKDVYITSVFVSLDLDYDEAIEVASHDVIFDVIADE